MHRDVLALYKALQGVGRYHKALLAGFKIGIAWWIAREPRKNWKEDQEDQGTLKQLGGSP